MRLFLDTSALLKRYVNEPGSDAVDQLFEAADEIVLAPIARIEAYTALHRKQREGALADADFTAIRKELETDLPFFSVVPFGPELELQSLQLVSHWSLRTLDAMQLAAGILAGTDRFVTADRKLGDIAGRVLEGVDLV